MSNKNRLQIVALLLLIGIALIGVPTLLKLQTMVAGPEGVDARLYGVEWTGHSVNDGGIHPTSGARPSDTIGWVGDQDSYWTEMYWKRPDPYNPDVEQTLWWGTSHEQWSKSTSLGLTARIRQAQVHEVNIHGDPLGTRGPTEIVWYSWESTPLETGDTIEWTRHEAFVVPVDFVFEVSVRARTDGSWGTFEDTHLWLVLDTVRWYDAFAEPYGQIQSGQQPPEGADLKAYAYRGAFPIWAWIEAWDPFVIDDQDGDQVDVNDIPDEMDQYLQISPSLVGSRIPLYNEPNWEYVDLFASDKVKNDALLQEALAGQITHLPDPRFAETVFTPITLSKYGALKQWGLFGPWYWEHYYYPTSYIRIRALYVIWGEWIYLWTKQEAEDQGYQWQNRTSVIIHHTSAWDQFWGKVGSGLSALTSHPLFWLWSGVIGLVVLMVLVLVFAPWLPSVLAKLFGGKG